MAQAAMASADTPDMDSMFLGQLTNGTTATATVPASSEAPDMDQMFLTKLRPEVSKPKPLRDVSGVSATPGDNPDGRPRVYITKDLPTSDATATPGPPVLSSDKPQEWNLGHSIAYGMTQGWSPEIIAKVHSMLGGTKYEDELGNIKKARQDYIDAGNSGKDLLGTLVGSTATALPLMALGQEYAAAPLANAVKSAAPAIAPILDFLAGAGKGLSAIPSQVARGAAEGATAAGLQSHMGTESVGDQLGSGAMLGGALGPIGNLLMKPFQSKINSTVAQTAKDYLDSGGDIRAGQLPGAAPIIKTLDSWFSKGKTAPQLEKFNEALTGQAGVPAKHIDQDWVKLADAKNGNTMNSIVANHSIPGQDPDLIQGFKNLRSNAMTDIGDPDAAKIVNGFLDKIEHPTLTGDLTGPMYRAFTQQGDAPGLVTKMANHPNGEVRDFARNQVRPMLDNLWGKVLGPNEKAEWDTAKRQYKNTRIIDARVDPATGEFDPRKLLKPTERSYGNVNNADKSSQMGTLAKVGQFMLPAEKFAHGLPHSVSRKVATYGAAMAAGTAGAHAIEEHGGELLHAAVANPTAMTLPILFAGSTYLGAKGLNELMSSPRYTRHLLDQVLSGKHGKSIAPYLPAATYAGTPRE